MSDVYRVFVQAQQQFSSVAIEFSHNIEQLGQQLVEGVAQETGKTLDSVANNSLVQWVSQLPGASKLLTFLGQVDIVQMEREVIQLQQEYPQESPRQISDHVIQQAALQASAVGLLTNLVPPLALTLFAVDLAAMTRLQAEMVYRIAAAYGFPLTDPSRRGEVLAIFGLSMMGSSVLKTGTSFIEIIPLLGAASGASVNAVLILALGQTACEFYEAKQPPDSKSVVVYESI